MKNYINKGHVYLIYNILLKGVLSILVELFDFDVLFYFKENKVFSTNTLIIDLSVLVLDFPHSTIHLNRPEVDKVTVESGIIMGVFTSKGKKMIVNFLNRNGYTGREGN